MVPGTRSPFDHRALRILEGNTAILQNAWIAHMNCRHVHACGADRNL